MVIILHHNTSLYYPYRVTLSLNETSHTLWIVGDVRRVSVASNIVQSYAGSCSVEWIHCYKAYIPGKKNRQIKSLQWI